MPAAKSTPPFVVLSRIFLMACIGVVGIFAVVLFFYAVPAWDDLIRAMPPVEIGWWNYVYGFVYKHWQGRWASCGLECTVLPRVDITRYYWALLLPVALINSLAAYFVCRWFTPGASRRASLLVSLALLALLWTTVPSVGELVYWFTGAVENALVLALAALLIIGLLQLPSSISRSPGSRLVLLLLMSLAGIIICGFHELYGLMLCGALAAGAVASFYDPKLDRIAWITVTVAAGVGLLIVVLAPGNSRGSHRTADRTRGIYRSI